MFSDILQALQTLYSLVSSPLRWLLRRVQIWVFRFRSRNPPLDHSRALQIARSVLAGYIVRADSYRNMDFKHAFLVVARRSSEVDADNRIYIFEQLGNTFKKLWTSEVVSGLTVDSIDVHDINGDGINEIIFEESSFGSGAGTRVLMVYSTARKQLYQVSELYNWQDAAGPLAPDVEIQPDCDASFLRALERCAVKHGFLQSDPMIDFDKPEFAVQRWHAENGRKRTGTIKVHYYDGLPSFGASLATQLDTGEIHWSSYFKGPVFGYVKSRNQHFIAYSPAWIYNWAKCLAFDGERLWLAIHCESGLLCFHCGSLSLSFYSKYEKAELPEVEELVIDNDALILNGDIEIPVEKLVNTGGGRPLV